MSREKNIKGFSMPTRPRTFDEFWAASVKAESLNENMKYLTNRENWLKSLKENKSKQILDKIPVEDLPHIEQIDSTHSKVGDFIDKATFEETYDEEGIVMDELGDNGVICYAFSDTESRTWWAIKKENGNVDGLVRIK